MTETARRPTPERFLEAISGFQRTAAIRTALELDLFTAIGEGARDVGALAAATGAAPRGIRALANFLCSLGFLTKDGELYGLPADTAMYLDRRSPSYLGDTSSFYASPFVLEGFARTTQSVRRGGSDPASVDSMAPGHPVWLEYARGMAPLFAAPAAALAELLLQDQPSPRRALDVAAGHGLFGIELARRVPNLEVTALDWPAVLAVARDHAKAAQVSERYHTLPGNAFDVPLGDGWDLVILANFLHHFDAPTNTALLRRVHRSLAPAGRVVLVEFVPNDDRVTPPTVAQFGLSMLTTTPKGDVYTFAELRTMLEEAGFRSPRLHPLPHTPERAVTALR